ncbi:suppressor of tub2 mutation [Rhizina undulata]
MSVKDTQALDLLNLIRGHADADQKIAELSSIKAQVKHQQVQVDAISPLFEACRIGISSPNNSLSLHALSCLGHLIKRVTIQDPARIRSQANPILPLLIEKLGDQKERSRSIATAALLDLWRIVAQDVERGIKDIGFNSKNAKIKQESMNWLAQVHRTQQGFSFRSFTPYMIKMLEDASEPVRETSKEVVVELFRHNARNAPDHAKSDLKRELQKRQVRKGISTYILSQLGLPGSVEAELHRSVRSEDGHEEETKSRHGQSMAGSVSGSMASSTYVTSLAGSEMENMEPSYVNTNRELEDILHNMAPAFEGKESEGNWAARDKNITKLRQLVRGNAYRDYQTTFLAGIRSLLDGILKTANSLRTTISSNGIQLVKDLCIVIGPGMDPMVEILLINFIKLCAGTKKITAQLGNVTTAMIFSSVSYHLKLVQHLWGACNDKNVQPRTYASGWLQALLDAHADQKGYIEHTGGAELIEKCIKKGLADPNPGVREGMRKTYWRFTVIWPERAEAIMNTLDANYKKLLEKANPNGASAAVSKSGASSLRGVPMGRSQSAGGPARPSVKEAILAHKRSKGNLKSQVEDYPSHAKVAASQSATLAPSRLQSAPIRPVGLAKARSVTDQTGINERIMRSVSPPAVIARNSPYHRNGARSPPLSPPPQRIHEQLARGMKVARGQSPMVASRKLTVLEQLNHVDWRVRVEGIVIVACILAKKTPPNYDGQKMPTLPPSDVFAPTLAKLFNDPQPEVVEHVVAPEVLAELAKVVPMEQIVPKVLLLSEGDDEEHSQSISASSLPALKKLMSESEAAELIFRVITSLGASGAVPRKLAIGTFTKTQKRKIIHGCLVWLNETVEAHCKGADNEFLNDSSNFKLLGNRLIAMLNTTKPPNYNTLAVLLKNLQRLDPDAFDKILLTFETQTVRELRKAWGVSIEDENETVVLEEKVADVEQVLGSVPMVGAKVRQRVRSPDIPSPKHRNGEFYASSPETHKDEDFTLINPLAGIPLPPTPRPVTPTRPGEDKENKLVDLPPLPQTPERIPDALSNPNVSVRKPGRPEDKTLVIKVYQDPIIESNGAVATTQINDKGLTAHSDEWYKSKMKRQISNSNLPKTPEHSARLLATLITRLQNREIDTQAFRKLIGIARENPVRGALQEQNGEAHDIWEGGRIFDELLTSLLEYLSDDTVGARYNCSVMAKLIHSSIQVDSERAGDLRIQGLLVLKQLLSKAAPYFTQHEPAVLSTLINIRGKYPTQSHVTTGIEEISEEFMAVADPSHGIDAILNLMLPEGDPSYRPQTQSWCMGLTCLAALVRASKIGTLERQFEKLGQLAVKSLDDEDAEVRRACVAMCIEMHSKLNDDERLFDEIFQGMKSGHQNLLTYYFAKREGEQKE